MKVAAAGKKQRVPLSAYEVVTAKLKDASEKAEAMLAAGFQPWGSPYFSGLETINPKWIQVFIKQEG